MRPALVISTLACLIVACGGSEGQAVSETGRLVVQKSLADGPVFIEGSLTYVRIVRDDGQTIVDEVKAGEALSTPLFDEALRPGDYSVETVERPCSGNCMHLDEPVESTRCATDVRVRIGATATVSLVLESAGGSAPAVSCVASSE